MSQAVPLERYLRSFEYETRRRRSPPGPAETPRPVITISRQAGAGAHIVGEMLVARLRAQAPRGSPPWTLLDRDLVETVLMAHDLPDRLAEYMPEDRVGLIADTMDDLFGLHPPAWTLVRKTADTILRLAEIGNVVVIGRGACVITAKLESAFHVRLVGSPSRRIAYLQERLNLSPSEAERYVHEHDLGRTRYVRKYYGKDIDDPLLFHLVINTDRIPHPEAARMIADAVTARQEARSGVVAERPIRAAARTP